MVKKKDKRRNALRKKELNITNRKEKTDQNIQMGFSKTSFPLYRTLFQMFAEQSSSPVQEKPFR
jgi:hypothetical protein